MTNEIEIRSLGELDKEQMELVKAAEVQALSELLTYVSPIQLANVLQVHGFTLGDEVDEIIKTIRQDVNLPAKLSGIKLLRSIIKESIEASGASVEVSRKTVTPQADGTEVVETAKITRMVQDATGALKAIQRKREIKDAEIIDAEPVEPARTEGDGSPQRKQAEA